MKTKLLLLFVLASMSIFAQCPPTGAITLTTQADVNNFITQYPNCSIIDGNFSLVGDSINNISGLSSLTTINGGLTIQNTSLTNVAGLNNLNTVQRITLSTNAFLTDISQLSGINVALVGNISITYNNALISLNGLQNITAFARMTISNNPALTSLSGLDGLSSSTSPFSTAVNIENNAGLTSLNGLQNLINFTNSGGIRIFENPSLTDISPLSNVGSFGTLEITNNVLLSNCAILSVCNKLSISNADVIINGNATGCESVVVVESNCSPDSCPPSGSITLTTQAEVDAFVAQYPNCTTILGDFTIEGSTINNISGLINLTTVDGSLTIQNTALTSLNGFQNLNSINGIVVSNNPNLTSIDNLQQVNASVYEISISNNPQLTSLFGLNGITSTTSLHLVQLPLVNSLQPLSGLGGFLPFVYIASLPIQNLTGLNQVTTSSTFNLVNLPNLNSLQGLNQLTDIIFPSPRANDNDYPQEVLGFAYGLSITNTAIANLDELSNLTNMNGTNLSIVNNTNLISLTGLTNLIPTSVGYLEILNNALLSNCATTTICSILENIDEDSVFIEVNNTGCTTVLEVENACEALSTTDFELESSLKIYPNPFNNHISIALGGDYQNVKTTLVDVTGKQFYSKTFTGNTIEINQLDSLSSGIYFVTIELENGKTITQKIVK